MSVKHQLLLTYNTPVLPGPGPGPEPPPPSPGTVFLEPQRSISVTSESFLGFVENFNVLPGPVASAALELTSGGLLRVITSASGDFTFQTGAGEYLWLLSGSSTQFSVRAIPNPSIIDGVIGNQFNTWIPLSLSPLWSVTISSTAFNRFESRQFAITLQIAASNNLTNILATGFFNFTLESRFNSGFVP